jgi:hypothetical protein
MTVSVEQLQAAEAAVPPVLRNMTPFDEISLDIDDLYSEAANWADGSPIESQEQCDALDVLDKALLDAGKRLDALRVEEKRPLDEQVQAIQDRYNPYIQPKKGRVDLARSCLNPLRAAWKTAEAAKKEEAAAKARAEAEALRQKAEAVIRASAGNLVAREAAEEQLSTAKEAEKFAKRQEARATTGLGLRTTYHARLTDGGKAAQHYWNTRRAEFQTFLSGLAAEDVRRGIRSIPGFDVIEETKAV